MMAAQHTARAQGTLLRNEPMARHTTWRVGGHADRYYRPANIDDLAHFLAALPADEPVHWVGLGSNLLVRDGGIRGTVIAVSGALDGLVRLEGPRIRAEAGVSCARVARFCSRQGLGGAEFLAGIPGTFGGALAMNAGAFGGETWTLVDEVETLGHDGSHHRRAPQAYRIGYRSVEGPADEWFAAATLRLTQVTGESAAMRVRELLKRRGETQPIGEPSAGSVFRNPPGDHAARLIDACGLKGTCLGGACVSEKHANFIVNIGGATAADIEALIVHVAETVERMHGVRLQPEVRIVGEPEGNDHG